jgi:hypothetical protein
MKSVRSVSAWVVLTLIAAFCWTSAVLAGRPDWQHQEVNWRIAGGSSIKAIDYPYGKAPSLLTNRYHHRQTIPRKKVFFPESVPRRGAFANLSAGPVIANVIDSPPVNGFVPWIVVSVTDKRLEDLELDAVTESSVVGNYPAIVDPQTDYAIGIFDTGASANVMGYADADQAGLFYGYPNLVTSNMITVSGVIGSVDAWVSQPLGLFIDGLGAIDPDTLLLDASRMIGESNVSIIVGQDPGGGPDLATAVGTPMSVFYTTVINNEREITVIRDGNEFTGPDVRIYEQDDPCIPNYANIVPLELRPLGASSVQYVPSLDDFFEFPPASPSVIIGNFSQSVLFVSSVDLMEGNNSAIDKDRFMFDTGAQVTVIGSRVAARLKLNPNNADFEVEIQDVTGQTVLIPGFYVDSIEIPALGEWLSFTDVPVIWLDVASPEGGTLDGIIGMNLFTEYNLVLRGGGFFLTDDPTLEFEPVPPLDLAAFADAWLATPQSPNWNPRADLAPPTPDDLINFLDLAVFAEHWGETAP